jgi:phasin family protein
MDFEKMLKDFKLPGMDVKGLVDSQSRNAQAVAEANRVSLEGIRSLSERQTAIMRETFDEVRQAFAEIRGADNLEDAANRQSEVARKAMEKGMANMRELTDMVTKSNSDAFEVVNQRMNESLEEFRKLFSGFSK